MFMDAIADSDWVTVKEGDLSFTFSCMPRSIIVMEVCRDGRCIWDNPGPMMPGQLPDELTQPVLDKLNAVLTEKYKETIDWVMPKKDTK